MSKKNVHLTKVGIKLKYKTELNAQNKAIKFISINVQGI
jgi:hypothetical protein